MQLFGVRKEPGGGEEGSEFILGVQKGKRGEGFREETEEIEIIIQHQHGESN